MAKLKKQIKGKAKVLVEDISAFNCPACKGGGLVKLGSSNLDIRCENCLGTGKI